MASCLYCKEDIQVCKNNACLKKDFIYDWVCAQKDCDQLTYNNGYGKVEKQNGYIHIQWNKEGCGLSYRGEKLESNIYVSIKLDAGTRYGFNGIVYTVEQFELLLKLVR